MLTSHTFTIKPPLPFRLDLTAWILCRRPDNQVDRWDGQAYRRVLMLSGKPLAITVTQIGSPETPLLQVLLNGEGANYDVETKVKTYLGRLLGINKDLREFYQFSEKHADLKSLIRPFRGARPPRFASLFEALVNAIACQQLSLTVGIRLISRLSQAYGQAFPMPEGLFHAFPRPEDLVNVEVEELRKIGFSHRKGDYLLGLARLMVDRQVDLDELENLEDAVIVEQLCQIRGIGRWTAEYFLLRGLGRTHVFPGDDVGARNNLQHWLGLPDRLDYRSVGSVLAAWKEYGGLIYFHLLLKSLMEKGTIIA